MKIALVLFLMLAFADVNCPYHPLAICTPTATHKWIGGEYYTLYRCNCGDFVWSKD